MKYVLVFVLLTCVLSASIKERLETAAVAGAAERDQQDYWDLFVMEGPCDGYWKCEDLNTPCECITGDLKPYKSR